MGVLVNALGARAPAEAFPRAAAARRSSGLADRLRGPTRCPSAAPPAPCTFFYYRLQGLPGCGLLRRVLADLWTGVELLSSPPSYEAARRRHRLGVPAQPVIGPPFRSRFKNLVTFVVLGEMQGTSHCWDPLLPSSQQHLGLRNELLSRYHAGVRVLRWKEIPHGVIPVRRSPHAIRSSRSEDNRGRS